MVKAKSFHLLHVFSQEFDKFSVKHGFLEMRLAFESQVLDSPDDVGLDPFLPICVFEE